VTRRDARYNQRVNKTSLRAAVLAGSAVLSMLVTAAAFAAEPAPRAERVSEHGWYVRGEAGIASAANRGYNSNAGFVVTREGIVVFDALGTPVLGREFLAAIRAVSAAPIRRVIVSHYHADHVYGLPAFKATGAEVWSHARSLPAIDAPGTSERLAQRRADLFPWVDETTVIVRPDFTIDGDTSFRLGGLTFRMIDTGGAHAPDDIMLLVEDDRLLFAGDLMFAGRIPFVGNADSKRWLAAIERLIPLRPAVVVPGHGPASRDVGRDLALTRDYLAYLRDTMGRAARDLEGFDEAYARTDWSRFASLPAFEPANRINAYGTYLRMEQEALDGAKP
jgi:glyoxylase-like metal-dependent hydrolase (beta-lactamase superfamily II)